MLLAYIDEVGETGAFVSRSHAKFNTSAAFGYAGFVVPAAKARHFGSIFDREKRSLFAREIAESSNPAQWEYKGANLFRPDTPQRRPQNLRVFDALLRSLRGLGGSLFFYCDHKPVGTPKQTGLDPAAREAGAMQETLNRIARCADRQDQHVMVVIDQINEKTRAERLPNMYGHILGRAKDFPEMRRIIEPPMHVDSQLSANIQFADWVAACVGRAVDYQLIEDSRYAWVAEAGRLKQIRGSFTHESKLHLHQSSLPDINHSDLFAKRRPLFPRLEGQQVSSLVPQRIIAQMKAAADRAQHRPRRGVPVPWQRDQR